MHTFWLVVSCISMSADSQNDSPINNYLKLLLHPFEIENTLKARRKGLHVAPVEGSTSRCALRSEGKRKLTLLYDFL